jgi:hypothetical protein
MEGVSARPRSAGACFVLVFSLVSTLLIQDAVAADIVRLDLFNQPPPPPKKLSDLRLHYGFTEFPALWGQELIGTDLAKEAAAGRAVRRSRILISDNGVNQGIAGRVQVPGEPSQVRRISLRFVRQLKDSPTSSIPWVNSIIRALPDEVPDPMDPTRADSTPHGEHVAGIVGTGPSEFGVSETSDIYDFDIFKGMNRFELQNLKAGLYQLLSSFESYDAMNMSHSLPSDSELHNLLSLLKQEKGTVLVAAAHNQGMPLEMFRGLSDNLDLLVVGAMSPLGTLASFSNYGVRLDLVAPGEGIISRGNQFNWNGERLEMMSGTSMAAPFVSGAVGTIRSLLPDSTPEQVEEILKRTSIDLGAKGRDPHYGEGMLNHLKATEVALRLYDASASSPQAIDFALSHPAALEFDEASRAAIIEARKAGFGSIKAYRETRRAALLSNEPDHWIDLGTMAHLRGWADYGTGLMYLGVNQENAKIGKQRREFFARSIWSVGGRRLAFLGERSHFDQLSHADLTLALYEYSPEPLREAILPFFENRIYSLNPKLMSELNRIKSKHETMKVPVALAPAKPLEPLPNEFAPGLSLP